MAGINNAVNDSKSSWFDSGLNVLHNLGSKAIDIYGGYYQIKTANELQREQKRTNFYNNEMERASKIKEQDNKNLQSLLIVGALAFGLILIFKKIIK